MIKTASNTPTTLSLLMCAGVIILSFFLFLFRLNSDAIVDYDEGIYAQVISQTSKSEDLLTLKLDGPWFEKPPLYIWAAIISSKLFRTPEFAMRFPAALAGIISVILTMLITYEIVGSLYLTALSGLILILTPAFLEAGRQVRFDVPITMAILFALYSFIKGKKNPLWYIGIGVGIGVGIMLKSIIGLFVLPFILIWSYIEKDFSWLRNSYLWRGITATAIITIPWHLYETLKFGMQFWNSYLFHHIINRFASNVLGGTMSNIDYLIYLARFASPWIFIFLLGIIEIVTNRNKDRVNGILYSLALCIFFILAIFFAAQTKLVYYILPIFPLMAVVTSYLMYTWYLRYSQNHKQLLTVSLCLILLVAFANTIYAGFHFQKDFRDNQIIAADEKQIGLFLLTQPLSEKIYVYKYPYLDTIRYYSAGRTLEGMNDNQVLEKPFYLIMSTYEHAVSDFPPELKKHFSTIYSGQATTLLKFKP